MQIGIAPLVDCVFLLLIFFLLTSSFRQERFVDVHLPNTQEGVEGKGSGGMSILIKKDGALLVSGKEVDLNGLTRLLRCRKEQRVNIFGDDEATYGRVARVFQLVRRAGVSDVGLAFELRTPGE